MRFLSRKSEPERLLDTVSSSLDGLTDSLTKRTVVKAGLIAGGVAGLTAASAGISSLRRRLEGVRGDS
jgi:hypothetical protein